jgi:hypothetical protein
LNEFPSRIHFSLRRKEGKVRGAHEIANPYQVELIEAAVNKEKASDASTKKLSNSAPNNKKCRFIAAKLKL